MSMWMAGTVVLRKVVDYNVHPNTPQCVPKGPVEVVIIVAVLAVAICMEVNVCARWCNVKTKRRWRHVRLLANAHVVMSQMHSVASVFQWPPLSMSADVMMDSFVNIVEGLVCQNQTVQHSCSVQTMRWWGHVHLFAKPHVMIVIQLRTASSSAWKVSMSRCADVMLDLFAYIRDQVIVSQFLSAQMESDHALMRDQLLQEVHANVSGN